MYSKTFLGLIVIAFVTLFNNSNAAVEVDFYKDSEYNIICNGELRTFDGSKEALQKVNNLIYSYFNIDSIGYDKTSNTINFKCLSLKKDTNCVLILNYMKNQLSLSNNNEQLCPNITIDGGSNTFKKLVILGFHDINFYNID